MRIVTLCFVLALGCGSGDEPDDVAPPSVPALSKSEIARGRDACDTYAERICRCAAAQDAGAGNELATECQLARSRPEALEMTLAGLEGKTATRDVKALRVSARQIIKSCIEADGKLDPAVCPRAPSP